MNGRPLSTRLATALFGWALAAAVWADDPVPQRVRTTADRPFVFAVRGDNRGGADGQPSTAFREVLRAERGSVRTDKFGKDPCPAG